jgi:hypothetical protein
MTDNEIALACVALKYRRLYEEGVLCQTKKKYLETIRNTNVSVSGTDSYADRDNEPPDLYGIR